MTAVIHPAFHQHSRGYGLIGTRPTPTKPSHSNADNEHDTPHRSDPATSSSGRKPRMEVYVDLFTTEPLPRPPMQPMKGKKSLDKNQKTTLDRYFARPGPEGHKLHKSALSDKSLNVASKRRDSGLVIDLTESPPPKKRKASAEGSGNELEGKKGKKQKLVDENGKARKKLVNGSDEQRAPVKRVRKIVEPIWTTLPGFDDRAEVEARIQLREFVVRFRPILRLAKSHLDALDEFGALSRETAKAVAIALLDLIAVDVDGKEKTAVKFAIREVTAASGDPLRTWEVLEKLLKGTFNTEIEVPASATEGRTRRSAGKVSKPEQLVEALLALVDITVQGESVKLELAEGEKEMKEKGKVWSKAVKDEEERWQEERGRLVFERPGKSGRGATKEELEREKAYKAKYAAANKAHKQTLASLNSEYFLNNSASISRFQPLGRDVEGRVYYILSPYADGKIPPLSVRESATKWSWLVAVWGRKPLSASTASNDEGHKPEASEGSTADVEHALASGSSSPTLSEEDLLDRWHAFTAPTEIRRLAKWADHVATSVLTGDLPQPEKRADGLPPTTGKEITQLVDGLNGFADYLEWRCKEEDG